MPNKSNTVPEDLIEWFRRKLDGFKDLSPQDQMALARMVWVSNT
jgi:hypothetical protein